LTGSGSVVRKGPEPDPDPDLKNQISANFILTTFFTKICSYKYCTYIYEPKSEAIEIFEVMAFTHTKKVYVEPFIKARIRIWIRNTGVNMNVFKQFSVL
jgi:hypothetical protein